MSVTRNSLSWRDASHSERYRALARRTSSQLTRMPNDPRKTAVASEAATGKARLLLKTWIEKYWDTLFPLLDPEDNNDPIQRVNLLQTLSSKAATEDKFLERLSEVPLAESPRLGKYNLKTVSGTANKQEVNAAFADTNAEQLRARYDAAVESVALVKEMDSVLAEKIGGGHQHATFGAVDLKGHAAVLPDIPGRSDAHAGAVCEGQHTVDGGGNLYIYD